MLDRRQSARDKVIYGGVAKTDDSSASRDCVVRNISENGASTMGATPNPTVKMVIPILYTTAEIPHFLVS